MGKSKVERTRRHLESMSYETLTPEQALMKREMDQGLHKLGAVLDEVVGTASTAGPEVTTLAYEVIEAHGDGLTLGLRQWQIVQNLVEAGIKAGYARGSEDAAPHRG